MKANKRTAERVRASGYKFYDYKRKRIETRRNSKKSSIDRAVTVCHGNSRRLRITRGDCGDGACNKFTFRNKNTDHDADHNTYGNTYRYTREQNSCTADE